MQLHCPNCNQPAEQHSQPVRGPSSGNDLWVCISCPAIVCGCPVFSDSETSMPCYMQHTHVAHPGLYGSQKQPTVGNKKNKKDKKR